MERERRRDVQGGTGREIAGPGNGWRMGRRRLIEVTGRFSPWHPDDDGTAKRRELR